MPQSLGDLEQQRSAILHRLTDLGDLRPGSITTTSGRCGKANCRCHRPNELPHGPTDRLTYKVKGKTVSESLSNPAAIAKAERELLLRSQALAEFVPAEAGEALSGRRSLPPPPPASAP